MSHLTASHWTINAPMNKHDDPDRWTMTENGIRVETRHSDRLLVYTYDDKRVGEFDVEFLQNIEPDMYTNIIHVSITDESDHVCTRVSRGTPGNGTVKCWLAEDGTIEVPVQDIDTIEAKSKSDIEA